MITVDLEYRLLDCPVYWQNFILAITENKNCSVRVWDILFKLKDYNARYVDIGHTINYVEFESEKDLTMFMLRWL